MGYCMALRIYRELTSIKWISGLQGLTMAKIAGIAKECQN